MKHPEGFHVDVAGIPALPRDLVMIRMSVRDFDEAYKILIVKGFTNTRGDKILVTESAKTATMESPSGFRITIVEHFRK